MAPGIAIPFLQESALTLPWWTQREHQGERARLRSNGTVRARMGTFYPFSASRWAR